VKVIITVSLKNLFKSIFCNVTEIGRGDA